MGERERVIGVIKATRHHEPNFRNEDLADRLIAANLIRGEEKPVVTKEDLLKVLMRGNHHSEAWWSSAADRVFTLLQSRSMPSGGAMDMDYDALDRAWEQTHDSFSTRRGAFYAGWKACLLSQGFEVKP